jgi:hypothetical protein
MTVLPIAFYGCGTWSLTLGLAQRSKIFDNRLLRRIFEPKRVSNGRLEKMA